MNPVRVFPVTALLLLMGGSAVAHHSTAMFDNAVASTISGTVKQFQWTNPHCWIQVLVVNDPGAGEWSIEMGSPSQLYRGGWRPGTLKEGDKITLTIHPMKDGSHAGLFVSAVTPDGKPLGTHT
ncbi:MAG TPA: DUF6152 family protein [Steroidobacteraceae bacterium]|nr:DUF6152 family protein [Steroidobacteraceae bacterium]